MPKHSRPAKVVSIIDRKGGGGKTTVMHHLTTGVVLHGNEALAIECDDNPRLRAILSGLETEDAQELDDMQTAYGLFAHPENGTDRCALAVHLDRLWENVSSLGMTEIHDVRSERNWAFAGKLDYIPGSEQIKEIEDEFARKGLKTTGFAPDLQLARALHDARNKYDVILMDSPPSLTGVLHNILIASTHVIIVVEFDFASIEDYRRTYRVYDKVCKVLRADGLAVPKASVVYNKFNATNEDHQAMLRAYTGEHSEIINGQKVTRPALIKLPSLGIIPFNGDLLNRAAMNNRSLHQYAPKSDIGVAMYEMTNKLEETLSLN